MYTVSFNYKKSLPNYCSQGAEYSVTVDKVEHMTAAYSFCQLVVLLRLELIEEDTSTLEMLCQKLFNTSWVNYNQI